MDIKKFLPENLKNQEVFDKFTQLLQVIEDKEDELLKPIKQKLNPENTMDYNNIIEEFGLNYLSNLLSYEVKSLLITYFSLIRAFKGHRSGLELIFEVLGWEYQIKEWWEIGSTPYTADILLTLDVRTVDTNLPNFLERLQNFIRNYVYPVVTFGIEWITQTSINIYVGNSGQQFTESVNIQEYNFESDGSSYQYVGNLGQIESFASN